MGPIFHIPRTILTSRIKKKRHGFRNQKVTFCVFFIMSLKGRELKFSKIRRKIPEHREFWTSYARQKRRHMYAPGERRQDTRDKTASLSRMPLGGKNLPPSWAGKYQLRITFEKKKKIGFNTTSGRLLLLIKPNRRNDTSLSVGDPLTDRELLWRRSDLGKKIAYARNLGN